MDSTQQNGDYTIPVLDFCDYDCPNSEGDKELFIENIGDALKSKGFFALTNHGIEDKLLLECYKKSASFFALDEKFKKEFENKEHGGQRGYTSFGTEHAKDSVHPDLKEFWHIGPPQFSVPDTPSYLHNVWPDSLVDGFRDSFEKLFYQLNRVSIVLLEACSEYLGEDKSRLSEIAVNGNSILRLIHYPPLAHTGAAPGGIRSAAHEDINLITLLPSATASGLEILDQSSKKWIPVLTPKNCIIVDSGDMLQNITNGYFKSTTHRVTNPTDTYSARYSMPFFVHPRGEVNLEPLQSCVLRKQKEGFKYPKITAYEYLNERLKEIGLKA